MAPLLRASIATLLLGAAAPVALGLQLTSRNNNSEEGSRQQQPLLDAARRWIVAGKEEDDLPDVRFVSLNTEGDLTVKTFGGFPEEVANVGLNAKWTGYGTKLVNILYYTNTIPDNSLLVYMDGNDVVWGGCSKRDFLRNYKEIVGASGARIVIGAETVCGEQSCDNATELPHWARERSRNKGILLEGSRGDIQNYLECDEQVKSDCRCDMPSQPLCRNFDYTGEDDADWNAQHAIALLSRVNKRRVDEESHRKKEPMFRYLNSGFVMGPASEIREMFQWAVFHYLQIKGTKSWMHDQGAIAEYWRLNPDKVALDYRGELSLQLPRLVPETLAISPSEFSEGKVVTNTMLGGKVQCFIHNNVNEWNGGPRAKYWWKFMEEIGTDTRDWEALGEKEKKE